MQNLDESTSATDYKYYPIKYTSDALTAVVSVNGMVHSRYGCWAKKVDKEKFLVGIADDYGGSYRTITLIGVGY